MIKDSLNRDITEPLKILPETQHVMLDIETLGTDYGSIVYSVGLVEFTPKTIVRSLEITTDPKEQEDEGLKCSADTMIFHSQWASINDIQESLETGLRLSDFAHILKVYGEDRPDVTWWSKYTHFDFPILGKVFSTGFGKKTNSLFPDFLTHRQLRCCKSHSEALCLAFRMTESDITDLNEKIQNQFPGEKHNSIVDAVRQSLMLMSLWEKI